ASHWLARRTTGRYYSRCAARRRNLAGRGSKRLIGSEPRTAPAMAAQRIAWPTAVAVPRPVAPAVRLGRLATPPLDRCLAGGPARPGQPGRPTGLRQAAERWARHRGTAEAASSASLERRTAALSARTAAA